MLQIIVFYSLAFVAVLMSGIVITRKNPIAGALAMVILFADLAALYGLLDAPAIATFQLLVYAGGIMVLVIMSIMLFNLKESELQLDFQIKDMVMGLAVVVLGLVCPIGVALFAFSSWPQVSDTTFGGLHEIGNVLVRGKWFPFEILSFVLIVATIGAIIFSKRKL